MRATSSTTPWTWSGVIVATEPTSSPVAGLKLSSVDWDTDGCVAISIGAIVGARGGGGHGQEQEVERQTTPPHPGLPHTRHQWTTGCSTRTKRPNLPR